MTEPSLRRLVMLAAQPRPSLGGLKIQNSRTPLAEPTGMVGRPRRHRHVWAFRAG